MELFRQVLIHSAWHPHEKEVGHTDPRDSGTESNEDITTQVEEPWGTNKFDNTLMSDFFEH
jgi:hypothetical protein